MAKQARKTGGPDWGVIRNDYVCSVGSLDEVAREHGVSRFAVKRRSVAEKWVEERAKFKAALSRKRQAAVMKELARSEAEIDLSVHTLMVAVVDRLQEIVDEASDVPALKGIVELAEKAHGLLRITAGYSARRLGEAARALANATLALDPAGKQYLESPDGTRFFPEKAPSSEEPAH